MSPLVMVHTCRSCTAATPGTSPRAWFTSEKSRWAGTPSSSTSTASRQSRIALHTMVPAMRNEMIGSASSLPVQAMIAAEASTPTELSRSPARCRNVERRFMLESRACVSHIPAAFSAIPISASSSTTRTFTGWGFRSRCHASKTIPTAIAISTAPLSSAARISRR